MLNPEQKAVLVEAISTMPIKHEHTLSFEMYIVRNRPDVFEAVKIEFVHELAQLRGMYLRDDSCPEPSPFSSEIEARMAMLFLVEEASGE